MQWKGWKWNPGAASGSWRNNSLTLWPCPQHFLWHCLGLDWALDFPLLGAAPGSSSGDIHSEPAPHRPLGRSPKPGKSKLLQSTGETGILNSSGMDFSPPSPISHSLAAVCFPLQFWEATALSWTQGFGFQFKVGVTPKSSFLNLENTQSCAWEVPGQGQG